MEHKSILEATALHESLFEFDQSLVFLAMFTILQVFFGVAAYENVSNFQERVHFSLFWAIQRHYGHDVSNTTILDLIQDGVMNQKN